MLHLASYDIVFQEIPGEVTLALNLSGCPNRCPGCHSPYLQEAIGETLDDPLLFGLLRTYGNAVTCVCFMGGDAYPHEVERLAVLIRQETEGRLKTGWYSGKPGFPAACDPSHFDYVKLGPYIEKRGGLDCPTTNQRLYKIENREWIDMTALFQRKKE